MKTKERKEARILRRRDGLSVKEIASRVGVARSSVSRWVRDIQLTDAQHEALRARNPIYNRQMAGRSGTSARRRAERLAYQEHGRTLARLGDPYHAIGCVL